MNSLDQELVELHRKERQSFGSVQLSNYTGMVYMIPVGKVIDNKMIIHTANACQTTLSAFYA
jgi:hypothetical protein